MTAPPSLADDLPTVLDDVRDALAEVRRQVRAVVDGIEPLLDELPAVAVTTVRAALTDLRHRAEVVVGGVEGLLAQAGSPTALRAAGAGWTTDVGAPVSRLAGTATLNATRADDHWIGVAADTYRNTLPAQQLALIAVTTTSDGIDAALQDLAGSITSFWVAVGKAFATLLFALASAAAAAGSVVGAPVAVALATAGLAACGGFVVEAVSGYSDIVNQVAARSAELDRRLGNDTAFPAGAWPRSTTAISTDASITDGDDTDWHLR